MEMDSIKCDECGKIVPQPIDKWKRKNRVPLKWFRISRLNMDYNKSLWVKNYSILRVNDDKDPDFCSEACAMAWFSKQLAKMTKKKIEKGRFIKDHTKRILKRR